MLKPFIFRDIIIMAILKLLKNKHYLWNSTSLDFVGHIFLVLRDHGVYMYVVYIWKRSSAHALGSVRGVASFITTDEQLQ